MRKAISGVLTAIVTPFTVEGALNLPALRQQVQRQIAAGNGIFCGGTNGEFFVLNEEEKIAVARTCVEEAAGRVPVVAHIGEVSTRETLRLGQQIARLGVDAVSAITPWFVPLKQEELINHYTERPAFSLQHSRPHREHHCPGDRASAGQAQEYCRH